MLPNIHLLGIQGSGKGTQSALLVKKYNLTYLASGNLFRERAQIQDALGEQIRNQLTRGKLLDNELLYQTVADFLSLHPITNGLLCDGVIRNLTQYEQLKDLWSKFKLTNPYIIHIDLSEEIAIEHIKNRESHRQDPDLIDHHKVFSGKLIQRTDDNPQAIATRFRLYHEMTLPVVNAATRDNSIVHVNGDQSIEQIHDEIVSHIEQIFPQLVCL